MQLLVDLIFTKLNLTVTQYDMSSGDPVLFGDGKTLNMIKTKNASTVNEIQRLKFTWLLEDSNAHFKIAYGGSTSPRINVTNTNNVL